MQFEQLGIAEPLLRAVKESGYTEVTPIQAQAIPPLLTGRDMLGCAQTGTGKTAAFALPILHRLSTTRGRRGGRPMRVLVLTPTRELAAQVGESFKTYGKYMTYKVAIVYGGVGQGPQVQALRAGVDILVACPGRLLDLFGQGQMLLDAVDVLVLDEADRMLDMGFMPDIQRILARLSPQRQTLLFSATMPPEIRKLANAILRQPVEVSVAPQATAAETVNQRVYHVDKRSKQSLLNQLLADPSVERALVFTRTKHGADRVASHLERARINAAAIHGDKTQGIRDRAIDNFKTGEVRVLVASDIASRGLDIDNISHVINFDVPNEPETYVHRIGRTGRAGASGIAISLCDHDERRFMEDIEKMIRRKVEVIELPQFLRLPVQPASEGRLHRSHPYDNRHGGGIQHGGPGLDHQSSGERQHGRPRRRRR